MDGGSPQHRLLLPCSSLVMSVGKTVFLGSMFHSCLLFRLMEKNLKVSNFGCSKVKSFSSGKCVYFALELGGEGIGRNPVVFV